jgi:CPA1 family monovalent cation:H+ antiporter
VARERALRAALASLAGDRSPIADLFRQELTARLADKRANTDLDAASRSVHREMHRAALQAARQAVLVMRANDEIGDDAFHRIEEELDWIEMASGQDEQ